MAEEYWSQGRDLVFCDGDSDVFTPNHEAVVVAFYGNALKDELQASSHEGCNALGRIIEYSMQNELLEDDIIDTVAMRCSINDSLDALHAEGLLTDDEVFDPYGMMRTHTNLTDTEISIAVGQADVDVVLYAQQALGWVRIVNYEIDLWQITPRKLKDLGMALAWHDTSLDLSKDFKVEDRSTGRIHPCSYEDMRAGKISHLGHKIYEPKSASCGGQVG